MMTELDGKLPTMGHSEIIGNGPPAHLRLPPLRNPRENGGHRPKPKGSSSLAGLREQKKRQKYLMKQIGMRSSVDSDMGRESTRSSTDGLSLAEMMAGGLEPTGGEGNDAIPEWAEEGIGRLLYERRKFIIAGGISVCVFTFVAIVFMFMLAGVCIEVFAECPSSQG